MQCPVCKLDQVIVEYQGVELDLCIEGCGIWFDNDELRQLFQVAGVPSLLHDLESRLVFLPRGEHGPEKRCPRCRGKMRHVTAPGDMEDVILDRCRRGHGLWFDTGELEEILSTLLGAEDQALTTVKSFLADFVPGEDLHLQRLDSDEGPDAAEGAPPAPLSPPATQSHTETPPDVSPESSIDAPRDSDASS